MENSVGKSCISKAITLTVKLNITHLLPQLGFNLCLHADLSVPAALDDLLALLNVVHNSRGITLKFSKFLGPYLKCPFFSTEWEWHCRLLTVFQSIFNLEVEDSLTSDLY